MRIILAVMLLLDCVLAGSVLAEEKRVALVIGNGAYKGTAKLNNTANDAIRIAEKLKQLGFSVTSVTELDRRTAIDALNTFSRTLSGADLAFFYYAGHGIQIGGQNFLLPVDVDVSSERALRYSAINIHEIVDEMERSANVSVVVLDACRDNPFLETLSRSTSGTRAIQVSRGLGPMNLNGRGAIIAYAASAGAVASDGEGDNSPYTAALLEEIDKPGIELGLMFRRVAGRVIDATRGLQRPELLVRLVDEVYLKPIAAVEIAHTTDTPAASGSEAQPAKNEAVVGLRVKNGNGEPRSSRSSGLFGNQVVRIPAWTEDLKLPVPLAWKQPQVAIVQEAVANDSYGSAQPIPLASDLQLRITPRRDEDWYRFEVPVAGELQVIVENSPAAFDLHARVWNNNHDVVADWQRSDKKGGVLDGRYPIPGPGSYWLQIVDGHSDAQSPNVFTAKLRFNPALDAFEPNNQFSLASPIPLQAIFTSTLYPRRDHDWYRLWIPAPGLLKASAEDVADTLDLHIRLINLDGKVVRDWVGPPRKGGDTNFEAELVRPGVYMLQIVDGHDDAASTEPFKLAIDFEPVNDDTEPNNSFGKSALREPSGNYKLAVFPRRDTDWISFDVEHPGQLQILATNLPPEIDIHARVWNENKDIVRDWIPPFRKGGDLEGFADLPKPGRYFVELTDGHSDASSPQLFDLSLTFTPQTDQYEPNNAMSVATPITPGGEIAFNILPKRDTDWFRIEAPSSGELAVIIDKSPKNLDLHFRVWNANRKLVRDWVPPYRKGGLTEGFADLPSAGTYFLEIVDGHSDDRSIQHATLKTVFTSTHDPFEPNNSFGQAKPVAVGSTFEAYILPKKDTEFYLLEAPRAGEFVVTIDSVDKALDLNVRLFDAEGKAGGWTGPPRPGGTTEARLAVKSPGPYRLQVVDGHSDARSSKPFTVNIRFE